jgi:glycine betaine/proline transport system permease protein
MAELSPARPDSPAWTPTLAQGLWVAALVAIGAFWRWGQAAFPWAFEYPKALILPLRRWIGEAMKWLLNDAALGPVTFADITRFLASAINLPYQIVLGILSEGITLGGLAIPPVGWLGLTLAMGLVGHFAGGMRLAMLMVGCFGFLAVFGQWASAMVTLASILVAVPLGVAGGVLLGIGACRWGWLRSALMPVLDLMQTIPVFAYLVPILILFGFNANAAVIATVIYAMPPMTRITILALDLVPPEVKDLGRMVGCTRRQMTWRVMVPSAKDRLMVGVNQVIMLSLNMVIIASMIGAGGLGFDVLSALRRLDFGAGLEAGLAIVALAVALDRLSHAFAERVNVQESRPARGHLAAILSVLLGTWALGLLFPWIQDFPENWQVTTGDFWSSLVAWINVNYFDTLEAIKNTLLLNILVPLKRFLMGLPWAGVAALLFLAGLRLSGWRLGLLTGGLTVLIAAVGLWEEAMITVYLCGISVVFAMLIGVPVGIAVAGSDRLWAAMRLFIDTLQTLPSFVYLMPAVMLFQVGDFTAMIAVVAYALVPAIRYTVLGLRGVDPQLIEASRAMGCTPLQILTRVRLKLAMPEILLGLNQTIMMALSMLVITALVGTRDLGQEVYTALAKADPGRGLVAGLCVAFIAIIADRLIQAGAARSRERLGLGAGTASG